MNRSILSLMYSRQPLFGFSQIMFKLLFNQIANIPLYNSLWSFAGFAISNIGIIRSVIMLHSIKKYIFGSINISTLTEMVFIVSPVVGVMFDSLLKRDLQSIKLKSFITKLSISRLINLIIFNSLLLVVKKFVKFIIKIILIIFMSCLSIFWLGSLNHTKYLLNIAFEIKDTIYNLTNFDLPIPDFLKLNNIKVNNTIFDYINSLLNKINIFKTQWRSPPLDVVDKIPHVRQVSKFEGIELNFNYQNSNDLIIDNTLINNFNDTSYINQVTTSDIIINNNIDLINFLIHLFNEMNLFV